MNNAPVLQLIGDKSVNENSLLTFEISAIDSDNDNIAYKSSNLPEGASLDNNSGVFEWTPDYDQSGTYYVEFIADDGEYNDSEYVEITVVNVNRPPVFSAIVDYDVDENKPLEITLEASDLDGDILEFTKDVSFGTISGNKFSWTPSYNDSGDYSINFAVNDGDTEVVQTARVSVNNLNRPPVLYSIPDVTTTKYEPVRIQLVGFDPDGDDLVYLYSEDSFLKDVASLDSTTGLFEWTPTDKDSDVNFIEFLVSDGMSNSSEKNAKIVIASIKSPPVFNPIEPLSINEIDSLSFEISADSSDEIGISMCPEGANFVSTKGLFEWTPTYEQAGAYIAEFWARDGSILNLRNFTTVLITVNNVNRAPEIELVKKSYYLKEKETLLVNLSVSDVDGDPLSLSTNASFGAFRGNTFVWTPDYHDSNVYNIQFSVSDGNLSTSTSATIYVDKTNMPPELDPIGSKVVCENDTLEFTVSAYDGYKDSLLISASDLPSGATFNSSSGHFTWSPTVSQKGLYTVSFQATDGELSDYETISITVKEESETDNDSETSSTTSSGGSGGGGGGGSQNTGEEYENIDFKDYAIKPILKDVETVFSFGEEKNSIISVSFTASLNGGQTKTVIEVLKDTSTLVSNPPLGNVYKNMNIWVGDGKFLPELISDAKVLFKVEKSWVDVNNIDPNSIKLLRYSGNKWNQLPTSRTDENDEYFYYVGETPGFSPFAISSLDEELINAQASGETTDSSSDGNDVKKSVDDETISQSDSADQEKKSAGTALLILILLGVVFIGLLGYKREYCEEYYEKARLRFSNHDGKRYRRLKR